MASSRDDFSSRGESRGARQVLVGALPAVSVVALLVAILSRTHGIALLGWDAYPIIVTSAVQGWNDLFSTFGEKLMDGRFTADYYRPLLNLSFALDFALWGLRPFGYQLSNALAFAACAAALGALSYRLSGGSRIAQLTTILVFGLHPLQFEILPFAARRHDSLCCLFMALSLWTQLRPSTLALQRPPALPAFFFLLATGAKETAFVLPLVSFAAVVSYSPRQAGLPRFRHAALAVAPLVSVAVLMLAARFAVIGGIGGFGERRVSEIVGAAPGLIVQLLGLIVVPFPEMRGSGVAVALGGLFATSALAAAIAGARSRPAEPATAAPGRTWRSLVVASIWLGGTAAFTSVVGMIAPWYVLLPLASVSLLAGIITDAFLAGIASGDRATRLASATAVLAFGAWLAWQASHSPLVQARDEWAQSTAVSDAYLGELHSQLEAAAGGDALAAPTPPRWLRPPSFDSEPFTTFILSDYSVQAWAELRFPGRRIRISHRRNDRPAQDEVLVLFQRRQAPPNAARPAAGGR